MKEESPATYQVDGQADDIVARALEIMRARHAAGEQLTSPRETAAYLRLELAEEKREVFAVLLLDNKHRVLAFRQLFYGTIDGAAVYPREVVRAALECNAAAAILTHNHPSGQPEPSQADQAITRRLVEALGLIDVRVLDHFVVGTEGSVSMAERGMV